MIEPGGPAWLYDNDETSDNPPQLPMEHIQYTVKMGGSLMVTIPGCMMFLTMVQLRITVLYMGKLALPINSTAELYPP